MFSVHDITASISSSKGTGQLNDADLNMHLSTPNTITDVEC